MNRFYRRLFVKAMIIAKFMKEYYDSYLSNIGTLSLVIQY